MSVYIGHHTKHVSCKGLTKSEDFSDLYVLLPDPGAWKLTISLVAVGLFLSCIG